MHVQVEHVSAGGLICHGPSQPDLYRRAAYYVDKILKGAKPSRVAPLKLFQDLPELKYRLDRLSLRDIRLLVISLPHH